MAHSVDKPESCNLLTDAANFRLNSNSQLQIIT